MISQRQYHEISILVDYRNNVAHSDYENIEHSVASRRAKTAVDLLRDLAELVNELDQMENEKIDPIACQTVN
ncbi:hypothetical protein BRC86_08040 [Halobacteriales archaeon QS_3_64_16]|nr:MAG: hypothetical protein BRC86_08040 [Halobacteriales archaeon QS_3_64_16]